MSDLPSLPCALAEPLPLPRLSEGSRTFADGWIVFVKRGCPTCQQVEPLLAQLAREGLPIIACSQDDPTFPGGVPVYDDRSLELSYRWAIEATPTLVRIAGGIETGRAIGWDRAAWIELGGDAVATNAEALALPPMQPG